MNPISQKRERSSTLPDTQLKTDLAKEDQSMTKGSEVRRADHPVDNLFLDRWSPRAMSGEEIPAEDLMVLFEAARWAPSSYNNQPWRILYARRDTKHWQTFFDLLVEFNQSWVNSA